MLLFPSNLGNMKNVFEFERDRDICFTLFKTNTHTWVLDPPTKIKSMDKAALEISIYQK